MPLGPLPPRVRTSFMEAPEPSLLLLAKYFATARSSVMPRVGHGSKAAYLKGRAATSTKFIIRVIIDKIRNKCDKANLVPKNTKAILAQ